MMKWYFVPVDFSSAAKNAARYALHLAGATGGGVHFFYAFQPDLDVQSPFLYDSMAKLQETWMEKLENWSEALSAEMHGQIPKRDFIRHEVSIGFAAEEIIRRSEEGEYMMIVMGTKGDGSQMSSWLGTVSSKVALEAYCPVWLIPVDATLSQLRNLLYSSGGDALDEKIINQVVRFARKLESTLHFVHIHNTHGAPEDNVIERIFESLGAGAFGDLSYIVEMINGDKVSEELSDYIGQNDIDLIVTVTHHKTFWEKLITHSITKELVLHAEIPMLVIHREDKQTLRDYVDGMRGQVMISRPE